jgi:hypothetical protein
MEYIATEWVGSFNHERLLKRIGDIPLIEPEAAYYHVHQQSTLAE